MIKNLTETGEDLSLFDFLPVGICIIDPDYNVLFWNRCLENWSGLKTGEMTGSDLRVKCEKLKSSHFIKRFGLIFSGGPPDGFSSQLHKYLIPSELHNGKMRIQHTTVIALQTEVPGKYNAMIICEDVTNLTNEVQAYRSMRDRALMELDERVKTENALRIVNTKLNLMNSITRHDILNQLTVAIIFRDMIEQDNVIPPEKKAYGYLNKMEIALNNIQQHISFTKDYQDMGIKSPNWYDIAGIVDKISRSSSFSELEVKNGLRGYEIYADPLFEKVIYTLFDNAVRHGKKVTRIEFSAVEEDTSISIVCEDNGIGIPVNDKEKIFERGFGEHTGLGLFLSRDILSITGISIKENGKPGVGARFEISVSKDMCRHSEPV